MSRARVMALMRKEWLEIIYNRTIVWTFMSLGVIFTALPLILAFFLPRALGGDIHGNLSSARLGALLQQAYPNYADMPSVAQFQVFMLRQFVALFLILPVMGAMSIATYSIIGEKTSRSLEALLAAPVRTYELLGAKTVSAAVPAVLATWGLITLFGVAVWLLAGADVARLVLDPPAIMLLALGVPLVALFGLGAGVVVSSRVNDPRSAQQVGGLIILPLVAIMVGQSTGLFLLSVPLVLAGALILAVLDVIVLALGVSLFNRETILTRWK
jgi:ABC-2 type transport system permease protein